MSDLAKHARRNRQGHTLAYSTSWRGRSYSHQVPLLRDYR